MAYITGTVTSANPSADLYTNISTALTTSGYTLVDTVVISTRTHKIWKSAAANNTQGLDWYLDVAYTTTGNGNMWLFPMEYFDPATDLATRMVVGGLASTTVEQTYFSRWGATGQTLESANWGVAAGTATALALTVQTSSFGYWISVTGDRVIAMTSVTPTAVAYSGFYTPHAGHLSIATSAAYPLVYALFSGPQANGNTSPANTSAALTRVPRAASYNWGLQYAPYIVGQAVSMISPPMSGTLQTIAPYQAVPIAIAGMTGAQPFVGLFGFMKDMYAINADTPTRGDTCTISGATYVMSTPSSFYSYMFGTL